MPAADPRYTPDPGVPNLSESIRLMLASAVSYLHARLELFSLEAKDAAGNYVKIVFLLVCALLGLISGFVFMLAAFVTLIAWLCHWHWGWVFFGFGFLMLGFAVVSALIAKSRFSKASFPATAAELKKDKEWLSQTKNVNRSQTLSVVRTN